MKHFTLYMLLFSISFGVSAQDLLINTEVCGDSVSSVRLTGPWWGWDPNGGPAAVDNQDGTWTFTIPAPTADMEYLLIVDGVQENLIAEMAAGGTCAPVTDYANYANRKWILGSGDVSNTYQFCGGCPQETTFRLDMGYIGLDEGETPVLRGSWDWANGNIAMSDSNNDNIWEASREMGGDAEYRYSIADSSGIVGSEVLNPSESCTNGDSANTNRTYTLEGSSPLLPVVCFESCSACVKDTATVTFQVDMTQYTETFTTPEVNGTFNSWCGNCAAMTDADGNGIWEINVQVWDSIEYKFSTDSWTTQEELTEGDACTKSTMDGSITRVNRFLMITGDTILPAVCWNSCSVCDTTSDTTTNIVSIANNTRFSLFPNPSSESFVINAKDWGSSNVEITVFNTLGAAIYRATNTNKNMEEIDVKNWENGLYIISIESSFGRANHRMVVSH